MKKLREQRQTLQDVERLITTMKDELDKTRNLLYRMYLKNGDALQDGVIAVPDTLMFSVGNLPETGPTLSLIDTKNLGLPSTYQEILQAIKELEK